MFISMEQPPPLPGNVSAVKTVAEAPSIVVGALLVLFRKVQSATIKCVPELLVDSSLVPMESPAECPRYCWGLSTDTGPLCSNVQFPMNTKPDLYTSSAP